MIPNYLFYLNKRILINGIFKKNTFIIILNTFSNKYLNETISYFQNNPKKFDIFFQFLSNRIQSVITCPWKIVKKVLINDAYNYA